MVTEELFNKYRRRLKINDTISASSGLVGLFIGILEYEIYYSNEYVSTPTTDSLRALIILLTIVCMTFVISHYVIYFAFLKEAGKLEKTTNF
jgi:multisubunit Na+/H+ antiporter MnhG subunit